MADELHGDGHSEDTAAEAALSAAVDGRVTDVEWWAHRLIGPESRSVTVYQGVVGDTPDDAGYFVVLDERDEQSGATYPETVADSVAELFATYRADTEPGIAE